jgi:serine protease Do
MAIPMATSDRSAAHEGSGRVVRVLFPIASFIAATLLGWMACAADDPTGKNLAFALQDAFADAIERSEASLVSVVRMRNSDGLATDSLLGPQDDFKPRLDPRRMTQRGVHPSWGDTWDPSWMPQDFGSGVIVSEDGFILTNHHVIERADVVWVVLHTGKAVRAEIWAADPRSDLAVLRITAGGLKPIVVGDASKTKKGHIVLALGNPLAMARDGRASASWGIIANIARRLPQPGSSSPEELTLHHNGTLFQTDARLNYGTSGGALLNLKGEMIGLVTALAAVRGYDQAAGYAIPLDDMMKRILDILLQGREVEYGFLGVLPEDVRLADGEAARPGAPREGARVAECYLGSPGALGGLVKDDVIVGVAGLPVRNREDLVLTVGTQFAGNTVPFDVIREGRRITLKVTLGKFPVSGQIYATVRPPAWRGLRVDYASVLLRRSSDGRTPSFAPEPGVLITEVQENSPAAQAGITPNTVLTQVGGTHVQWPAEFRDAVGKLRGTVELVIDNEKISVPE